MKFMEMLEVILLVAGAGIFTLSFLLPKKTEEMSKEAQILVKEEVKAAVSKELEGVRGHVDEVVEEAVGYAVEKTERSLERLSNEKIMAVSEYSDTVLKEIHKNHEEAVFLYDMLNSKHNNLKDTVSKVDKTVKEAAEATKEAEAAVNQFQKLLPNDVADAASAISSVSDIKPVANTVSDAAAVSAEEPEDIAGNMILAEMFDGKAEKRGFGKGKQKNANATATNKQEASGGNKNEKILALHKEGKSQVAIAQELGLGVGEVKLVIDLYKNV